MKHERSCYASLDMLRHAKRVMLLALALPFVLGSRVDAQSSTPTVKISPMPPSGSYTMTSDGASIPVVTQGQSYTITVTYPSNTNNTPVYVIASVGAGGFGSPGACTGALNPGAQNSGTSPGPPKYQFADTEIVQSSSGSFSETFSPGPNPPGTQPAGFNFSAGLVTIGFGGGGGGSGGSGSGGSGGSGGGGSGSGTNPGGTNPLGGGTNRWWNKPGNGGTNPPGGGGTNPPGGGGTNPGGGSGGSGGSGGTGGSGSGATGTVGGAVQDANGNWCILVG